MNIKQCFNPKCAGQAQVTSVRRSLKMFRVTCFRCNASGPEENSMAAAVEVWNAITRPAEKEMVIKALVRAKSLLVDWTAFGWKNREERGNLLVKLETVEATTAAVRELRFTLENLGIKTE